LNEFRNLNEFQIFNENKNLNEFHIRTNLKKKIESEHLKKCCERKTKKENREKKKTKNRDPTRSALVGRPTPRVEVCGAVQAPTWSEHRIRQELPTNAYGRVSLFWNGLVQTYGLVSEV
jgi:hypothetical protein